MSYHEWWLKAALFWLFILTKAFCRHSASSETLKKVKPTLWLQRRRPQHVGAKLTGPSQRAAVLCYTKRSLPLQRQVADTWRSNKQLYHSQILWITAKTLGLHSYWAITVLQDQRNSSPPCYNLSCVRKWKLTSLISLTLFSLFVDQMLYQ